MSTPHQARDAMVRDGVATQAMHGVEPTPTDVERLAVSILESVDRKAADAKPAPTSSSKKPGAIEREFEKRGGAPGTFGAWHVDKKPIAAGEIREKKLKLDPRGKLISRRLALLRSYPEWAAKLATVNPLATCGALGPQKQLEADRAYRAIIRDSCRVFGPVFKGRLQRLWFV